VVFLLYVCGLVQERLGAWLLGGPGAGGHRPARASGASALQLPVRVSAWLLGGLPGAQTLSEKQAASVLRAWVSFAANPSAGRPARGSLRAVVEALAQPLACDARQVGGAVGLLQRSLTSRIAAAPSIDAVADIWETLGEHFNPMHVCAALHVLNCRRAPVMAAL